MAGFVPVVMQQHQVLNNLLSTSGSKPGTIFHFPSVYSCNLDGSFILNISVSQDRPTAQRIPPASTDLCRAGEQAVLLRTSVPGQQQSSFKIISIRYNYGATVLFLRPLESCILSEASSSLFNMYLQFKLLAEFGAFSGCHL